MSLEQLPASPSASRKGLLSPKFLLALTLALAACDKHEIVQPEPTPAHAPAGAMNDAPAEAAPRPKTIIKLGEHLIFSETAEKFFTPEEKNHIQEVIQSYVDAYGFARAVTIDLPEFSGATQLLPDGRTIYRTTTDGNMALDKGARGFLDSAVASGMGHANTTGQVIPESQPFHLGTSPNVIKSYSGFKVTIEANGQWIPFEEIQHGAAEALASKLVGSKYHFNHSYGPARKLMETILAERHISHEFLASLLQKGDLQ